MATRTFSIDVDAVGHGKLIVDGEDLSDRVTGFDLSCSTGEVTVLTLHQRAQAGPITGTGIVQVAPPADMIEQLAKLIEGLDPRDIEERALNSPDLVPGEYAVTRQVLIKAARLLRAGA